MNVDAAKLNELNQDKVAKMQQIRSQDSHPFSEAAQEQHTDAIADYSTEKKGDMRMSLNSAMSPAEAEELLQTIKKQDV